MGVVAGLEIVVRDARTEVMDVVEADISGEPLEDFGKLVKGASFESSAREVPVVFAFPINAFELVLDVEEPDTGDRRDANGRELNEEVGEPSEDQDERDREQADGEIHRPDGSPEVGLCAGGGEAFADDEEVEGGENEEDERVSHRTVDEALPKGRSEVFVDRHGPDIACSASVEVTRGTMVNGVFPFPMTVGREGEDSGDEADDVVGAPGFVK